MSFHNKIDGHLPCYPIVLVFKKMSFHNFITTINAVQLIVLVFKKMSFHNDSGYLVPIFLLY